MERAFNCLLEELTTYISGYSWWSICDSLEKDVKFVIILPTYFNENAQQFVYETAVKVIKKNVSYINITVIFKM